MQFLQFQLCDFATGAAIPFGKCTVYLTGTSSLASLFDSGGSPISNPVVAASTAQVGFAAADGFYDFQPAAADGTPNGPKILKQQMFDLSNVAALNVADRTALAAIASPSNNAFRYLEEAGREGPFVFSNANLSAKVSADSNQGIYVAPAAAPTGASGAWVRKYDGPIWAHWFGVADGAASNAARVESIETIFYPYAQHIRIRGSATGKIDFDRGAVFTRPHRIECGGMGTEDWATPGVGPTVLRFPYGCGKGFRFKHGPGGTGVGSGGAQRASLSHLRIEFTGTPGSNGVANYAGAGATTISVTSGAANFANGQVVLLEGAGLSISLVDRAFTLANGATSGTWAVTAKDENGSAPYLGNAIGYVGQQIDIGGAGLPAGTTITAWGIGTFTVSNAATAAGAAGGGAVATIKCPLVAEIQSGGGTATLTIDNPYFGQPVTGGVLRHADCGVYATCTIDMTNVEINVQGSAGSTVAGGGIGLFLRGSTSDQSNADNCLFTNCKFTGGGTFAGVVMEGYDAQVNTFVHCNFAGPKIGVLDISSLGSSYVGKCHWAGNVGIMIANYSAQTLIDGGYFESGTSYLAPPSCQALAVHTQSLLPGSGFESIGNQAGGYVAVGLLRAQRLTSAGGVCVMGVSPRASWLGGNINSAGGWPGETKPGWAIGGDGNVGGNAYQIAYATPDGTFTKAYSGATEFHFGTSFGGSQLLNLHPTSGVTTPLPLGYEAGAGGAVTQATSRTTGVTLDKVCGAITLFSAAGAATWTTFTVTNSKVAATDTVRVVQKSGTDLYQIHVTNVAAGSFKISFATTGGVTVEQPVFNFAVLKSVAA